MQKRIAKAITKLSSTVRRASVGRHDGSPCRFSGKLSLSAQFPSMTAALSATFLPFTVAVGGIHTLCMWEGGADKVHDIIVKKRELTKNVIRISSYKQ